MAWPNPGFNPTKQQILTQIEPYLTKLIQQADPRLRKEPIVDQEELDLWLESKAYLEMAIEFYWQEWIA